MTIEYDEKNMRGMKLQKFISCFDNLTEAEIYDENDKLMTISAIGDVTQKTLNGRYVKNSQIRDGRVVVFTACVE